MGVLNPPRVFLLSPAFCGGRRGTQVMSPNATFALARELASRKGAPLGLVFAFMSGLYFRGKLTYALRFARPPRAEDAVIGSGVHVITPSRGLQEPHVRVTRRTVEDFAVTDVDCMNPRYRRPLERTGRALARALGPRCEVVLLGSIASPKYSDLLLAIFGSRLLFPVDFVGRGDMSRGGLLLRRAREGEELEYAPLAGATVHGMRPPKLSRWVPPA
jgi:hypothetical protein